MHENISAAFDIRAADEEGVFEGYASVFDLVDDGEDIIERGAFAKTLKEKQPDQVRLLWQHDPSQPIGIISVLREDTRGLYVKGRLLLDVERAREAHSLMRVGALDGLSIGYRTNRASLDQKTGIRHLQEIDLWEVSLVTFPMQAGARIHAFKGNAGKNIRDYEAFLRDAGGFSRREAKILAASGFKALSRREAGEDWAQLLNSIYHLTNQLKECSYEQ